MTDVTVTSGARRPCPPVSDELIDYLDWVYPDRLPNSGFNQRLVDEAIGSRKVIERLRLQRMRQER